MTIVQPHSDQQQKQIRFSNGPTFQSAIAFDSVKVCIFSDDQGPFEQIYKFGDVIQLDRENIPPYSEFIVSAINKGEAVGVLRLPSEYLDSSETISLVHRIL